MKRSPMERLVCVISRVGRVGAPQTIFSQAIPLRIDDCEGAYQLTTYFDLALFTSQ